MRRALYTGGNETVEQSNARQQALALVDEFFVAFNSADNVALLETNRVPQVMLNAGLFILAETTSAPIINMNFQRMRERENWSSFTIGDFEALNVSPNQVIVELSFERLIHRVRSI